VPACPNDAVFELDAEPFVGEVPVLEVTSEGWRAIDRRLYRAMKPTQIAIFADGCNECGNCDVFCPEDGGPYIEKPRLYGTVEAWTHAAPLAGFVLTLECPTTDAGLTSCATTAIGATSATDAATAPEDGARRFVLRGRFAEGEYRLTRDSTSETAVFETTDARVVVDWHSHGVLAASPLACPERAPLSLASRRASGLSPIACVVDLSPCMTLRLLMDALVRPTRVHFVNAPFVESPRA
jgi:ferredoxin